MGRLWRLWAVSEVDPDLRIHHSNYLFINFPRFFNSPPTPYFVSVIFPRFFNSSTTPPYIPLCQDDKGLWCTTGWPKWMWKTSRWVKLGMFHHPAWEVASYSSGPAAAKTVWTWSTGGFHQRDGSPCFSCHLTPFLPRSKSDNIISRAFLRDRRPR